MCTHAFDHRANFHIPQLVTTKAVLCLNELIRDSTPLLHALVVSMVTTECTHVWHGPYNPEDKFTPFCCYIITQDYNHPSFVVSEARGMRWIRHTHTHTRTLTHHSGSWL